MSSDPVTYESVDRVAIITLNRPDKLNALNGAVTEALADAWARLNASDDGAAIITGAGDRAFTAGADLNDPGELWRAVPNVAVEVRKPIVCAVNGLCVGGGVLFTQYADLCVAAEEAWFSYPEAKVGFTGGLITSLAVRIPVKVAMELILIGDRMSAARAYEVGMINRVVPREQLMDTALEFGRKLAANAPLVIQTLREFVGRTVPKGPTELAGQARAATERTYASEDLVEGKRAFAEKRKPRFSGR